MDSASSFADLAARENAVLGLGLPVGATALLEQAGHAFRDEAMAESLIHRAAALAPGHPAVLIALYRFYFYKGRLAEALGVAERCLTKALSELDLPEDWRQVRPGSAPFGEFQAVLPRFLLFSLKGYAYLNMRLGNLDEGHTAIAKLLELDPTDRIGAKVLRDVLLRKEVERDQ